MSTAKAKVTLHAGGMGNATEADYWAWVAYVASRIDEMTGLDVDVEATPFGVSLADDQVSSSAPEHVEALREALEVLWGRFCMEDWPR